MSKSTISHETALALKSSALAFQEADAHLRSAGDTADGIVEEAAAEYLERRADHQANVDKATAEYEGDPADAEHEAEEVAATPAEREAAASGDTQDGVKDPDEDKAAKDAPGAKRPPNSSTKSDDDSKDSTKE